MPGEEPLKAPDRCPACGGGTRDVDMQRTTRCPYCGADLFTGAATARSFTIEPGEPQQRHFLPTFFDGVQIGSGMALMLTAFYLFQTGLDGRLCRLIGFAGLIPLAHGLVHWMFRDDPNFKE